MIRRKSYSEAIDGGGFDISTDSSVNSKRQVFESMSSNYISSSDDSTESESEINKTKSNDAIVKRKLMAIEDQLGERSHSNFEMRRKDGFVRSNSVKYYNTNPENMEKESIEDVHQSVEQIYNTFLSYVSNESLHSSRKSNNPGEFSALRQLLSAKPLESSQDMERGIERVKSPIKVENLNENRTSFHFNVNVIPFNQPYDDLRIVEEREIVESRVDTQKRIFDDIYTEEITIEHDTRTSTMSDANSSLPMQYVGKNKKKKKKDPKTGGNRTRRTKRVIFKDGNINVPLLSNIKGRSIMYLNDFVTTMIECQWRWLTFWFSACNILVWVGFALMYYVAAYANGDLEVDPKGIPCIADGRTFTGIFTFSVETQVSIGYGEKYPNEECPEIAFILLMEVIVGNALIGGMVCVFFAKIIRPEKHLAGVGFSKNAVVCMRDGQLCLLIRVWDVLQKHAIGTQIKGWYVKHNIGSGPLIKPLIFDSQPFVLFPTTVQHTIKENSPLYDLSAKDLIDKKFEIIITLTGSSRNSGLMTQSRTSYMSHEILWGSRFKEVMSFNEDRGSYAIDAKSIDTTETVDIPLCSARLLRHFNSALRGEPTSISLPASPFFLSPRDSPRSILASPSWSFKVKSFKTDLNNSLPG